MSNHIKHKIYNNRMIDQKTAEPINKNNYKLVAKGVMLPFANL